MVLDSVEPFDDEGNPRQRPQTCLKTVGSRSTTQFGIQTSQLFCIELRLAPCAPRSFQALGTTPPEPGEPSANTLAADVQFLCNRSLLPAGFEQSRCSKTSPFHPTEVPPGPKNFRLRLHAIAFYYKMKCLSL
jgi:hypothetical protein